MKLNNLIASPGFAAWMEGEALDVGKFALYRRWQATVVDSLDRTPIR